MGDRTSFQAWIYDCPDVRQQAAAAAVLDEYQLGFEFSDGPQPAPLYVVTDSTRNAEGKRIRRGQEALTLDTFPTREAASDYIAGLTGNTDPDRFDIDEVAGLCTTEAYTAHEMSLGTADEIAAKLIEAAPGCSFDLWEDPYAQYLGDHRAYTPELGLFTSECTANGEPVYERSEIQKMIAEASAAGEDIAAHVHKATGGPWADHLTAHQIAEANAA